MATLINSLAVVNASQNVERSPISKIGSTQVMLLSKALKLNTSPNNNHSNNKDRRRKDLFYFYNKRDHSFVVGSDRIKIKFTLADLCRDYDCNGCKGLQLRNWKCNPYNHNHRLTNFNHRVAQGGFSMTASYLFDALSLSSSALSAYWTLQTVKSFTNVFGITKSKDVEPFTFNTIKDHLIDLSFLLVLVIRATRQEFQMQDILYMVAGYFGTRQILNFRLSDITTIFSNLVPDNSSSRHTQGVSTTSVLQAALALISACTLGFVSSSSTVSSVLASVKTLGSSLLMVKTAEEVIVALVNHLPDVIFYFICDKFPYLGSYALWHSDVKFKNFLDRVIAIRDRFDTPYSLRLLYSSHWLAEFLDLHTTLHGFLTKENMDRGLHLLLDDHIVWFDHVYNQADSLGLLPGKRHLPFVIWLTGEPGVGKSTYAKTLAAHLIRNMFSQELTDSEIQSLIFSHSTSNRFFDGYNNQPVFILNDYLQYTQDEEEKWLVKFVDTVDLPLEVASVDNINTGIKGEVRFCSRFIIVTSNSSHLNASKNIINLEAFNRRRNIVVDWQWKDDTKQVNFANFDYSWAKFRILRPVADYRHQLVQATYENEQLLRMFILGQVDLATERSSQVIGSLKEFRPESQRLAGLVQAHDNAKAKWAEMTSKLTDLCKNALDYEIFPRVKVKWILPLLTAGSVAYLTYRQFAQTLVSRITQSLSGDVSTRKYAPERKPLKRYAMGMNTPLAEITAKITLNLAEITTTMNYHQRALRQTMWGLFLHGSLLVTPKHLWKRGDAVIQPGDAITIVHRGVDYTFSFEHKRYWEDPERDIACYNTINLMPAARSLQSTLMDDNVMIQTNGESALLVRKHHVASQDKDVAMTDSVKAYIVDAPYSDEFGSRYNGFDIWQYNLRTGVGDCGSPLLVSINGTFKVGGMHVAGDNYSGNAEVLTKSLIEMLETHFSTGDNKAQGYVADVETDEEFFDCVSDFDEGFIFHGKVRRAPRQPDKTEIQKSPLFEVLQPQESAPAVLTPSDPRLEVVCSPMIKSIAKYATPVPPFNNSLLEHAFRIVSSFYKPMATSDFSVFTFEDAINAKFTPNLAKLDIHTSPGYPWTLAGKSKKDLISMDDKGYLTITEHFRNKLNTWENILSKHSMPPYMLTATLKDERVSLNKVSIGKTRTFMNFPVEYTVIMRRYFDAFIDAETEHAFDIGATTGVNIYSSHWNTLFNCLNKFDKHLDGDFKAFDGTISPQFFAYYARLVNSFYNDEHQYKRTLLVQGTCFAPVIVLGKVYTKLQGNPSGSRLTTSFNSFVNRMYVVMSMLSVLPQEKHTADYFRRNVKIFAHGDDHLIGFSNDVYEYWNGFVLRDFMKAHNIEYTSSKKNEELVPFCPLKDCLFLKSRFVYNPEYHTYQCGLEKSVIQEMVSWQRDSSIESTEMIVQTAQRYAYFWGKQYFDEITSKLQAAIKAKKLAITLLDFIDLDIEYHGTGMLKFEFSAL